MYLIVVDGVNLAGSLLLHFVDPNDRVHRDVGSFDVPSEAATLMVVPRLDSPSVSKVPIESKRQGQTDFW